MKLSSPIQSNTLDLTPSNEDFFSADDLFIQQLKQFWFSRSLLFCNGAKKLIQEKNFNEEILQLLELNQEKFENANPLTQYKKIKHRAERFLTKSITRQGTIFTNLQQIIQHFGMNEVEAEIIIFSTLLNLDFEYGNCFVFFGKFSNRSFSIFLARLLDISVKKVNEALKKEGLLHQSGLLRLKTSANYIDRVFDHLSGFCNALDDTHQSIETIFSSFITHAPKAKLTPDHYHHIEQDYSCLSAYLQTVCDKNIVGSNVLIYGSPGTGKTQLVRTLVEELENKLYEISVEDDQGNILSGIDRVTACQIAQKLLEKGRHQCLLFDEVEDLFRPDMKDFQKSKGWINQLLENNAVPTFWLSNDISSMDKAFLRRFDLVFELPIPPYSVRKRMLTESLNGTAVSEKWIDRMSHLDHLPPAIINRASRVNQIIGETDSVLIENGLEQIIGNTLKAMGHQHKAITPPPASFYDPALINTKAPLKQIANGLKISREGRLCLFGAPGTGKSAFAKHLSGFLEIPLIAKRASDIIDCHVGNTEKNIAQMFEQATQENGLLLLDEADSFLRDRKQSQQSWETTQVNELLVQMENFKGIFICSTNLMNNLDSAALRRFDFKLEFTYLTPDQAWLLLKGHLGEPLKKLTAHEKGVLKKQLAKMEFLTPGDFATVIRKLTVMGEANNVALFIEELETEVSFKNESAKRSIGFLAGF